jgi:hypothetical protein
VSYSRETTVWCDWTGATPSEFCEEWVQEPSPHVADARKAAKRQGWVFRNGKDYCPEHASNKIQETHPWMEKTK